MDEKYFTGIVRRWDLLGEPEPIPVEMSPGEMSALIQEMGEHIGKLRDEIRTVREERDYARRCLADTLRQLQPIITNIKAVTT